ncbi:hypothetical protein MNEG_4717 [Monoraphidium neglectum]|uniref:Uncharacterized protein n=1 Tax=Monoraphidium neglectum TaxID=145388 RepID=A0A0D2JXA7_9CHLO|nr:hypothetical protein MNEG_4717 [Monoraphidium neglectum]KIZ03248.1 hypothetical protein MNEG_4717 [Monoraphidium neglectum]|eukprot:XP_013902267.1 hypothetical protein MNEG_4717 [Monoraphidium neglectum]
MLQAEDSDGLVFGPASCRRLSLDGPRPQMPLSPRGSGACASAGVSGNSSATAALRLMPSVALSGRSASLSVEALGANPLRRVSLPMPGQQPRPVDETLRRGSVQAPMAAGAAASIVAAAAAAAGRASRPTAGPCAVECAH